MHGGNAWRNSFATRKSAQWWTGVWGGQSAAGGPPTYSWKAEKNSTAATSPQERNAVREKVKLKSVKLKKVAWWNRAQMSRMACGWDPHIWRNGEHAYVDGEIEHDFILSGN